MLANLKRVLVEEEGAALVEYGLLVGLIAVVCVAAVTDLGEKVRDLLQYIADELPDPPAAP